jgi:CheY-like chemotaxis protein
VTAIARLAANADAAEFAPYDAIVLGLGRSAKENAQTLSDVAASLGDAVSRLLIYAPSFDSLDQSILLNPAVVNAPRAENLAQLGLLISAVLPSEEPENGSDNVELPDTADVARAKVLIVDDDIRNIYSLTSVLETYDIQVLHAERGRDGIAILEQNPDIDVALIDIMMPEMDGYETMREIRRRPAISNIPLISVTAKAMKGDRQKCLEAGASDYIAKPVDLDLLLALLRVWIARSRSAAEPDRERATSIAT